MQFYRCKKCLMVSTRPRITFDGNGVCNACQWHETKKTVDWRNREQTFDALCNRFMRASGNDCIVPWSGGKDSIYVAHTLHDYGMNPLLITIIPHLETEIGKWNRLNMCPDFDHLMITLEEGRYRREAKKHFLQHGRPKHPWENAISAVILQQAVKLDIPFVIYGEEGEQEYGGTSQEADTWMWPVSKEYLTKLYYSGQTVYKLPRNAEFDSLFFTQWSRFENWSPSTHANFAIAKGMRTEPVRHQGTLTTSSQISDKLQDLHMHLAFLKFGFGRCTADTSIAIRDGWMTREEAIGWVQSYEDELPMRYFQEYLEYFGMSAREYWAALDRHVNLDILKKEHEKWVLREPAF